MVYDLPVEEIKVKPHQITTLHLVCALAFIVAGAIIFRYNFIITYFGLALLIAGLLLTTATIAKNKLVTVKWNNIIRAGELLISLTVAIYSLIQQWKFPSGIFGVLSAVLLFALWYERNADSMLSIHIDDSGVKLPSGGRRVVPWTEIEQVVYRFGTVSVDCVDNRLYQWSTANTGFNSDDFEAYCRRMVDDHRDKRRKDDW